MVQTFLPNNLLQNTVNYSIFYPCFNNGSSLLATRLPQKHCKTTVFSKGIVAIVEAFLPNFLQNTVNYSVSSHVVTMVQAFWPNTFLQNTVNYSVFCPHCSNGSILLAKQIEPKHLRFEPLLQCGQETLLFIVFWSKWFGEKAWTIDCHNMGRKRCKLQCFARNCLARRLEPLLQHRSKSLYFTVFWNKLFGKKA